MNIDPDVIRKEYRKQLANGMENFFKLEVLFTEKSVFNPEYPIMSRKDGKYFNNAQNIFIYAFNQAWEKAELFFLDLQKDVTVVF